MKIGRVGKTAAICLSLAVLAAGLSMPAVANKEDGNGKTHKSDLDDKNMYINLGLIGDHTILCLGSATVGLVVNPPDSVIIYDPTSGTPTTTVPVSPGSGPTTIISPTTVQSKVCLGGSLATYAPGSDDSDAATADIWNVWIRDYVYNGCDQTRLEVQGLCPANVNAAGNFDGLDDHIERALEAALAPADWQVDLKVAGFAEMRQTVSKQIHQGALIQNNPGTKTPDPKSTQACNPAEPTTTPAAAVCTVNGQGTSQSHTRNINAFGFCGQGEIADTADLPNGPLRVRDPDDYSGAPNGGYTSFTTVKAVFVDGPVFGQLDCALLDGLSGELQGAWFIVASNINGVTCENDITCIFEEIPSVSSGCYADKVNPPAANTVNVAVLGIIGEVGWKWTESLACDENAVHGNWSNPTGATQTIPDIVIKVNSSPLPTVVSVSP